MEVSSGREYATMTLATRQVVFSGRDGEGAESLLLRFFVVAGCLVKPVCVFRLEISRGAIDSAKEESVVRRSF